MKKRDILVFVACCLGLLFLIFRDGGSLSLHRAFQERLEDDRHVHGAGEGDHHVHHGNEDMPSIAISSERRYRDENVPRPLVIDLDGDGNMEMVFASDMHGAHIKVIDFKRIKMKPSFSYQSLGKYLELPVEREISLRNVHGNAGKTNAKKRKRSGNEHQHPPTVVGLSAGILDFDVNEDTRPYVVVVLSNWMVVLLDSDLNIVWQRQIPHDEILASLMDYGELIPTEVTARLFSHRVYMDDRGMVVVGTRVASRHGSMAHSHHEHEKDDAASFMKELVEQFSHYNYYAFDGHTGELRWKHTSEDFLQDTEDSGDKRRGGKLHWQLDYKIETADTGFHRGELNWRNYISDMLRHLPHAYRHSHDTLLVMDYFAPLKSQNFKTDHDDGTYTTIGSSLRESISQFTSGGISTAAIRKRQRAKRGGYEQEEKMLGGMSMLPSNVLVSHIRKNIEVIHMYTGMLICQLGPLESHNAVYSDINDDDIVESVNVIGCTATIRGDVSTTSSDTLYKTNVCQSQTLADRLSIYFPRQQRTKDRAHDKEDASKINEKSVATPVVFICSDGSQDVLFLANNGLVTAVSQSGYSFIGKRQSTFYNRFQTKTSSIFKPTVSDGSHHTSPSFVEIIPYSLRKHQAYHDFILAIGDRVISAISPDTGKVEETFDLPAAMVSPVTFADIDGDGIQDIVVHTEKGLYGIQVRSHVGNNALTFCILAMVSIVAALYWSSSDALIISNPKYVRKSERHQK